MDDLERAFRRECTAVERCSDVGELLDKMAEYRHDREDAVARGFTAARLRFDDLIELVEDRIVELKAAALRARHAQHPRREVAAPAVPVQPPRPMARPTDAAAPPAVRWADRPRPVVAPAARAAVAAAACSTSPCRAKDFAPDATFSARSGLGPAPADEPPRARARVREQVDEEPVAGPASAAPPTSPRRAAPPTGSDLLRFRDERNLTQRAAAALLGVAPSTVAKAELRPNDAVGEGLASALAPFLAG